MKGLKMKKVLLIIILALAPIIINAQPVPPPSQNGQNGNQPGGGAPIDGGLSILLVLAAVYGCKKTYLIKKTVD
jgi:hypothetical protein